ncbi:MAG: hypothetical protein LBT94_06140 [Prevotellaceae bacterium]|jgi:hypothetical protein|nr:hypothetical protein [Prevotellaceae bacterium]
MKMLPPKSLAAAAALSVCLLLASCSLEGSYERFFPVTELGVVQYTPDSASWYIVNDASLKLYPKNAKEMQASPEGGARVLIVFNVLADESVDGYDYVVTLAYVLPVHVYDVARSAAATIAADSFDVLRNVERVWIGSRYLNVDYYHFYNAEQGEHEVSLMYDTAATLQGKDVTLFLRHYSKGDKGVKPRQNIASFDLESLRTDVRTDSINITFEAECGDGPYRRSLSYKFKN